MQILVQNKVIETTDIVDVVDIERDKKMFLNREAGFKIIFKDNSEVVYKEDIPYDSYPSEISETKTKWRNLMDKVIEQWKQDKADIPTFKL